MDVSSKRLEAEEGDIKKEEEETRKEEEETMKVEGATIRQEGGTLKEEGELMKMEEETIKEQNIKREEETIKDIKPSCESCQRDNVTTEASGICQECEEYMCNTCFRYHLKAKQCKNHIFINDTSQLALKNIAESPEKCRKHCNEAIKFYCREHKDVGCGDCIILRHSRCGPEYIKDISKHFEESEDLSSFKTKLEQVENSVEETSKEITNNKKECEKMKEEVLREIRKFRIDVNTYLDKAEADIITKVNRLMVDHAKLLDQLEEKCKKLSHNIEDIKQKLNTHANVLFIHYIKSEPKVVEFERTITDIRFRNKIKKLKFVPDEQLCDTVTTTKTFGSLNDLTSRKGQIKPHRPVAERPQPDEALRRWYLLKDPARGPGRRFIYD